LFSPQIPLQLQPTGPDRFEDFVAGPNQAAVEALQTLTLQTGGSLFLQGPPDSGKTHLLNALCVDLHEKGEPAWYIGLKQLEQEATAGLKGLHGVVCFDDLHAVVGDVLWEEALFHCFNEVREGGGQIVASSRVTLSALEFALPDLASRIGWGTRFKLRLLNEQQRLEVLQVRARKLELVLPDEVEQFLIRRINRDLGSLLNALETLQKRALAEKRRVTVPLAREALRADLDSD
jgi:DnaA family protein